MRAADLSNFHNNYISIPCGWCLNCRVDKMNELSDRCEYEYITFGCGAFVTFTFDDIHLDKYQFIDSKDGKLKATLSKKCAKEFLDRLNKEVHKYNKQYGLTPFCRPDYKYLIVGEYGENGQIFDRPHYHALFFGLDFAMCERLFGVLGNFKALFKLVQFVTVELDMLYHTLINNFMVMKLGLNMITTICNALSKLIL